MTSITFFISLILKPKIWYLAVSGKTNMVLLGYGKIKHSFRYLVVSAYQNKNKDFKHFFTDIDPTGPPLGLGRISGQTKCRVKCLVVSIQRMNVQNEWKDIRQNRMSSPISLYIQYHVVCGYWYWSVTELWHYQKSDKIINVFGYLDASGI